MPSGRQVRLVIGSQYENIDLVQIVLAEALMKLDLDEDTSHAIGMAVREAVANAIQHGNQAVPQKRVEIDFGIEDGEVVIRVSDEGEGFDPEAVEDPRSADNLLRPNGRGIFFMNRFMDEIDYSFRDEGGTVVTMRKRVDVPPSERGESVREETRQ